jgi:hypothetical protein
VSLPLRLALRDLRGGLSGLRLLAVCLFLGVLALAGVGSLSAAIVSGLAERGQSILGGDIQLSVSQRQADPQELAAIGRVGTLSQITRMRAMAARLDGAESILVELKGVDEAYPLYGSFRLQPGALRDRPGAPKWRSGRSWPSALASASAISSARTAPLQAVSCGKAVPERQDVKVPRRGRARGSQHHRQHQIDKRATRTICTP